MFKLDIPWPNPKLFPNRPVHFRAKAKLKASQKQDSYYLAKQHSPTFEGNISLEIVFHPPTNHRRDLDNCLASLKSALDGIADAWNVDDTRFRPITINFGEKVKNGNVKIVFN